MSEMGALAKLDVPHADDIYPHGITTHELAETYKKIACALKDTVNKSWIDANMKDELMMYGQTWTKGNTLEVIIKHQTTSPRTDDSIDETGWFKSTWRLWTCKGRMGCYGNACNGIN